MNMLIGTSAGGARPGGVSWVLLSGIPGTASQNMTDEVLERNVGVVLPTSSGQGIAVPQTDSALSRLRRLTGLTWEHLAKLFNVTRRSIHFWASGRPMNMKNETRLYDLLRVIQQADRGTASQNRAMLLRAHNGVIPFDQLSEGRYDEFLELVGCGPGRPQIMLPLLSQKEQDVRKPLPPNVLAGAEQDPAHHEIGRGRAVRTIRNSRHDQG